MRDAPDRIRAGQCRIRPLSPADLDAVLMIEVASFSNPWSEELFLYEMGRGDISRCFVAEVAAHGVMVTPQRADAASVSGKDTNIAGYLMSWLVMDELHITNLAVVPDHRRSGLATSLLGHSLRSAREEGALWCQLEVRVSNTAARTLYGKFGFREVGIRKGYYHDGEDAIILGLDL